MNRLTLTDQPDENELAWQKQQQAVKPKTAHEPLMLSVENEQPVESGLRVMDVLGLTLSTGLAGIISGGDFKTMLTTSLSSLFITRLFYALFTFLHENSHNTVALIQSPKDYKKILTRSNSFANYNLSNWIRLGFVFGKPTERPGVDLPLTGKSRRFNQVAGFKVNPVQFYHSII